MTRQSIRGSGQPGSAARTSNATSSLASFSATPVVPAALRLGHQVDEFMRRLHGAQTAVGANVGNAVSLGIGGGRRAAGG